MRNKLFNRFLIMLLSVMMVVNMLPLQVFAETDDTDYLFVATDRHANTSVIGNIINNIESVIGENELDYLALGGDMVGSGNSHPEYDSSEVLSEVTGATSSLSATNVDIVAGIHDMNVNDDAGIVLPYKSGGAQIYEGDRYYVYGVEEYCISEDSDSSNWSSEAQKFVDWANGDTIDKNKVIIVVSHYPLHAKRGDNDGAGYWHNALNTVATGSATGTTVVRDVLFFHGHNHTVDSNEYCYAPGSTLSVESYIEPSGVAAVSEPEVTYIYDPEKEEESELSTYAGPGSSSSNSSASGTDTTIYYTYATAGYLNQNSKATLISITGSEITLTKYSTSGSGSAMTTVERVVTEEEVTLSSIAVTTLPTKVEYTVGEVLDTTGMVVTATHSDGSTTAVDGYTVSDVDMTTAGTKTVTVTYQDKTATFDITVNEVAPTVNTIKEVTSYYNDEGELVENGNEVEVTGLGLTDVSAIHNEMDLSSTYGDGLYYVYDTTLTGYVSGETTTVTYYVYNQNLTGATIYLVDSEGNLIHVTGTTEYVEETAEEAAYTKVSFETTGESFTVAFGVAEVVVPEDYTLTSFEITNPADTLVYFQEDANVDGILPLDISYLELTATYTGSGEPVTKVIEWNEFGEIEDGYSISVDMTKIGKQDVVLSYTYGENTLTTSYEITIGYKSYTYSGDEDNSNTVNLDFTVAGVTEVTVEDNTATEFVVTAMSKVEVDSYISYDINLTGYTQGDKVTVTLSIPEDVDNPKVYYVDEAKTRATELESTISKDGKTVTFVTDHFSTYVLADGTVIETESGNATIEGSSSPQDVWKLTNSLTAGTTYLIVNTNAAGSGYALLNNNGTLSAVEVTIVNDGTDTYIELDNSNAEWTAAGSENSWNFSNNNKYIGYTTTTASGGGSWFLDPSYTTYSYTLSISDSAVVWTSGTNQLYLADLNTKIYDSSDISYLNELNDYYLTGGGTWVLSTTSSNIYYYEPSSITTGTVGHTYSVEGTDVRDAVAIKDRTVTLSSVLYDTPDGGTTTDITASSGIIPTYEVVTTKGNPYVISSISGSTATLSGTAGTAVVKVTYTSGDLVAWDEFVVTATAPDHYTINLYLNNNGVLGEEITAPVALKDVKAGDTYSVWAVVKAYANSEDTEGTDLGTLGDSLSWTVSDTSIATIDTKTGVITFTGNKYGTFTVTVAYEGADGKTITDTITISVTDTSYIVPGDGTNDFPEYPNEGAVRFDKTATAVGNFSETGIAKVELSMTGVPYSTGSEIDVVVMLDMTGSMSDNGMEAAEEATKAFVSKIVKNEDGSYNKNRIAVYAFNSGSSSPYELVSLKTISSDSELETANTAIDTASDKQASGGTPFDESAKKMYDVLQAAKTTNLPDDVDSAAEYDRQQFAVFMSDGGPTTYYGSDEKTYYGGNNNSGDVKLTSCMSGYSSSDSSDWSFTLPTEYYTDKLKADGVTVYTVGLLLQTAPSNPAPYSSMTDSTYDSTTDSLTTIGSHYYFCSSILKQMATDESKYIDIFNVDNASKATAAFEAIALSIREAATNVVVEDKIGKNYTVNFSLPEGITSNETDGLSNFYIQVVDYVLDSTTHERTGVYTVKENFTFNGETGALVSHTIDGEKCVDCNHVTTSTNGVITKIEGTYFTYEVKSDGEYLTWKEEKLTSNELALQYFAYLDNSAGTDVSNQIAAGTYYTNEYATLTYTNVNGNDVQQEFPIPQMTWNGAQVSYVFYLVNDAGQPVNKAGRVVPFAEAVYVTDVYTYSVVWNDMEQAAGLEAKYLAEKIVPEVYALYDNNASYNIHVYEKETEVNLNNHFVIGGDVTDTYNTTNSWTNANTTYVFNNKSDSKKYNSFGTYVSDDGDDNLSETGLSYFCKSAAIEGATSTSKVENDVTVYTVTSVGNGYQTVSGETQATVAQIKAAGGSTTGGTIIGDYIYYVDEAGKVYTIVTKTDGSEVEKGFDFSNTTVAFAVVWKPQLKEDTVVIDYGLDVVINVTTNDALASGVVGVRTDTPEDVKIGSGTYDAAKVTTAELKLNDLKVGIATVESLTSVRFSLDKTNGMKLNQPIKFYYESDVNFYKGTDLQKTSMYSSVTVIPATTVYYEDEYVSLKTLTRADSKSEWITDNKWTTNSVASSATQDVDRPGVKNPVMPSSYDADNVYGYDSAYENCSKYSLNSAAMVTVQPNKKATAEFSFYGTGFDIISLTSNTTGTILVDVVDKDGKSEKQLMVDTYYGYMYGDDPNTEEKTDVWYTVTNDPNALYQIPVMKVDDLSYGYHSVKITAVYNQFFDHTDAGSYDFYLDAIRIYNPAGITPSNTDVSDAYTKDNEYLPTYYEVKDALVAPNTIDQLTDEDVINGVVFIDSNSETSSAKDYANYGPNNEVYLAPNQSISFVLTAPTIAGYEVDKVHIAYKSVNSTGYIKVYDAESATLSGTTAEVLNTSTDMYRDITSLLNKTVVISNPGDESTTDNTSDGSIISITNVKVTYKASTNTASSDSGVFTLRRSAVNLALASLEPVVEEEVETPDVSTPEVETPDVTDPEVEIPGSGTTNEDTTTPDNGTSNSGTTEDNTSSESTSPEAPEGGVANEGNTSTDNTVDSENTETEVIPDNGTTEDKDTVTPDDTTVEETPETEGEENLGFFASLIKMIVDFITSMFSWLVGLVA